MTKSDFNMAVYLFGLRDDATVPKITAFLQGGLSVTGTWTWLTEDPTTTGSIIITDANGTRTAAPIDTITALREVPELTSKRA